MFSVHATPEKHWKKQQSLVILDLCQLRKIESGKSHDYRYYIIFENCSFKRFSVHTKTLHRLFSNSAGLKSVFEKLGFRDGFVWTVGLAVQVKVFSVRCSVNSTIVMGSFCLWSWVPRWISELAVRELWLGEFNGSHLRYVVILINISCR